MKRKLISMLFNSDMAQANMKGAKTETRRTNGLAGLNEFADDWVVGKEYLNNKTGKLTFPFFDKTSNQNGGLISYYGKPGDVLWMRETFCPMVIQDFDGQGNDKYTYLYKTDPNAKDMLHAMEDSTWKPNIHMPLEACPYFALITEIRLERLHEIDHRGAVNEGVKHVIDKVTGFCGYDYVGGGYNLMTNGFNSYRSLWISINGRKSWDSNPWVWVVVYRPLHFTELEDVRMDILRSWRTGDDFSNIERALNIAFENVRQRSIDDFKIPKGVDHAQ